MIVQARIHRGDNIQEKNEVGREVALTLLFALLQFCTLHSVLLKINMLESFHFWEDGVDVLFPIYPTKYN